MVGSALFSAAGNLYSEKQQIISNAACGGAVEDMASLGHYRVSTGVGPTYSKVTRTLSFSVDSSLF